MMLLLLLLPFGDDLSGQLALLTPSPPPCLSKQYDPDEQQGIEYRRNDDGWSWRGGRGRGTGVVGDNNGVCQSLISSRELHQGRIQGECHDLQGSTADTEPWKPTGEMSSPKRDP